MTNWTNEEIEDLAGTIANLQTKEEALSFMRDLLTIKEIQTFSMRWKTAKLLEEGMPYTEIEKLTGLSSATIARVNKFREYGMGGYRKALDKV